MSDEPKIEPVITPNGFRVSTIKRGSSAVAMPYDYYETMVFDDKDSDVTNEKYPKIVDQAECGFIEGAKRNHEVMVKKWSGTTNADKPFEEGEMIVYAGENFEVKENHGDS